jgi:hypothetical protein
LAGPQQVFAPEVGGRQIPLLVLVFSMLLQV